jgi:four helix bundle protein
VGGRFMDDQVSFLDDNIIKVRDSKGKYEINLEEKLLKFALKTIRLLSLVPYKREFDVFRNQLSKSATSIGANYQESQASSYPEFRQRIQICLRESRETVYWIKLLKELFKGQNNLEEKVQEILEESIEIKKIFGTIFNKIRKKL